MTTGHYCQCWQSCSDPGNVSLARTALQTASVGPVWPALDTIPSIEWRRIIKSRCAINAHSFMSQSFNLK